MVVSPAVVTHDAPARVGDVSMGIAVFPIAWIYLGHSKNWETIKFRQGSISVQPMKEKMKSLKRVKLRVHMHVSSKTHYN